MSTELTRAGHQLVKKIALFQSAVALMVAIFFTLLMGLNAGLAAFFGAFICLISSLIFAYFAFKDAGASKIRQIVRNFSQGSKVKLATTIILFVMALKVFPAHALPLLCAFIITSAAHWLLLFILRTDNK